MVSLDHVNIETLELEKSVAFYVDILGLEVGARPAFNVSGAWLYANGVPIIHLVARESVHIGPTGAIHHVALKGHDLVALKAILEINGVSYDLAIVPDLNVTQVFIMDPNQVRLEINFYSGA